MVDFLPVLPKHSFSANLPLAERAVVSPFHWPASSLELGHRILNVLGLLLTLFTAHAVASAAVVDSHIYFLNSMGIHLK